MINDNVIINGALAGSIILPIALGFSLSMQVLRFTDFALGGYALLGAWFFYFYNGFGYHVYFSFLFALASVAFLAGFFEIAIYRKMRKKESALLLPITAFAIFALLREVFIFLHNGKLKIIFALPYLSPQLSMISVSLFSFVFLLVMLEKTRTGKAMKAISKSISFIELAEVSGIDTKKLMTASATIASMLAALSGSLTSLAYGINADTGASLLIKAFAASVLAGGSIAAAAVVSLLIGFLENFLAPVYADAAIFIIIVLTLLVKSKMTKFEGGYEHECA